MNLQKKIAVIFVLYVSLFCGQMNAQELLRTVVPVGFTITAEQFPEKNPDRQILRSIALNNGINLQQVKIDFQANVFISIQQDSSNGQQNLRLKILNKKVSGDTYFRDFAIDSLLMPSRVSCTVSLQKSKDTLISFPVELSTFNSTIIKVLPDSLLLNADLLVAGINISSVSYRGREMAFNEFSKLINLYYAYNEILRELIDEYDAVSLNRKQGSVDVFIAWHQISRVNNYIQQYDFAGKLNLDKNDPQGFLKHHATVQRMEKRATTLFHQILKENKKGQLAEKGRYCSAYTQLSQKYLDRAHQQQPYIASGFEEVAQIFPSTEEKNKLTEVTALFDVFNRLGNASTPQIIYTNFLDLAQQAFDKNQFVVTLQLLKNAEQIEEWFDEVNISSTHSMLYNQSLDGVMTSFLRVAIIANRAGRFEMADKYYDKALLIYEEFGSAYFGNETGNLSFLHFTEQQVELSRALLADGEYQKAFALLNQARNIRKCESVKTGCPQIDSLISISLWGKFEQKMDTVDNWISRHEYDTALVYLAAAKQFVLHYENYFQPCPTQELSQPATILFEAFYTWGEDLLESKQPEKALAFFLKAQDVEGEYLPTADTRLKILVYNATVPVILHQIDKAEFETWANRMSNADSIYLEAKQLQHDYQQENNEELGAAFVALETKMEQRKCVDLNYRVKNLNTLIVNRVESGKFDLAARFLHEADSLICNHPNCKIDSLETRKMEKKYAALFEYLDRLKKESQYESEADYDAVIAEYLSICHFYADNNLGQFRIDKPSLYGFVRSAGNPKLTQKTVRYYAQNEDYMNAFRFLDLMKKQNIPARETKELQQLVGNGIGSMEKSGTIENQLLEPVRDDDWFRNFQYARIAAFNSKHDD